MTPCRRLPSLRFVLLAVLSLPPGAGYAAGPDTPGPIGIGSRRELFVDSFLVDQLTGATLALERPRDEGIVLRFDKPWEGRFCGYVTVLRDGPHFPLYYRGSSGAGGDGTNAEATCCAESPDGLAWTKPELGLFAVGGTKANNIVLAGMAPFSHNFCPTSTRARTRRPPSLSSVPGKAVSVPLAGKPVRLRFVLRDAPLFALQFRP